MRAEGNVSKATVHVRLLTQVLCDVSLVVSVNVMTTRVTSIMECYAVVSTIYLYIHCMYICTVTQRPNMLISSNTALVSARFRYFQYCAVNSFEWISQDVVAFSCHLASIVNVPHTYTYKFYFLYHMLLVWGLSNEYSS